jgi:hypothetical protein
VSTIGDCGLHGTSTISLLVSRRVQWVAGSLQVVLAPAASPWAAESAQAAEHAQNKAKAARTDILPNRQFNESGIATPFHWI